MYTRKYLSDKSLVGLKNYKYQSGEYGFMDYKMTPFWNACVEFLPIWMAPNLVTLIGFTVMVGSNMMYLPYDLSLSMEFHPMCYVISAFVVFFYQTMDAIDGKQARRTG